jgi:hypothetical protein
MGHISGATVMEGLAIGLFAAAIFGWAILRIIKAKALDIWLVPYIARTIKPRESPSPGFLVDVMFSFHLTIVDPIRLSRTISFTC